MTPAWLLVAILAAVALFQLALVAGAPLGRFAWGGQHDVLPRGLRIGSLASIVIYALIGSVMLDRAGVVDLYPGSISRPAAWVVVGYLVLGIGLNAASRSASERRVMVPVTVVLATLALLVARP